MDVYLVHDLRGKGSTLYPLSMVSAVDFPLDILYQFEKVLFYLQFAEFFFILKGVLILSNAYSMTVERLL